MRSARSLLVGCLALTIGSLSSPAGAQVNVEPLRDRLKEKGMVARLAASVASYAGNTRGVIFGGSGFLGFSSGRNMAYVAVSGDYTELNGVVSVAKWFGHLRHNYELLPWLWWEELAQIEKDRFRRVALRELLGTGPRFEVLETSLLEVIYGTSYLYEHVDLDTTQAGTAGEGSKHRWNNYVVATLEAHPKIVLSSITYFQPRFDEPSDFALLNVSSADFEVTERLHSRLDATLHYDSVAPADVRPLDFELKSSLELAF